MAVKWTEEQKRVIETRGRNILVSAAAGSGKTAVLVARILSRICDREDPANIDELLIVTFTKAAAGEMRDRLLKALLKEREQHPDDPHLARQVTLLPGAMITTIDGFCSYVVKNYGHRIGITPGARIAEAGEIELIRQDALNRRGWSILWRPLPQARRNTSLRNPCFALRRPPRAARMRRAILLPASADWRFTPRTG